MDKTDISVSIETDHLEALTYFLQKEKTTSPKAELGKALEELYEKTVPAEVRDYIDSRSKKPSAVKPTGKSPAKVPVRDGETGVNG